MLNLSSNEYIQEWDVKKKKEDDYYARKKVNIGNNAQKELIIDARDTEYIWCKAEVMAIIESKNEDNSILVHFIGWGRKYDEVLPLNSPRIAGKGFYTDRADIPHYQETDNKSKKPVMNLPTNADKIEIIEELKKDWFGDSAEDNPYVSGEPGEEQFSKEEIYEYLIEKATVPNNQTSLLHIPHGGRGGDVRIRVNTLSLNRLRSGFNRNHF